VRKAVVMGEKQQHHLRRAVTKYLFLKKKSPYLKML
jgi:hypothetical protein